MNPIALNHRVAPAASLTAFFDLAVALGITDVEIRNELPGVAIADGTPPETVRREADARGLTILTINALYPFNIWTAERAAQAEALIGYAAACDAKGIVMCPFNDAAYQADAAERSARLRTALTELAPLLRRAGIVGLVEPLGFPECSLRLKRDAVVAIDAVGGGDVFKLVHDTFHHYVAGETEFFPERTGLVHISGVIEPAVARDDMKDAHRVLVDADDRLDNLGQIRTLAAAGYTGPLSFEPFADGVSNAADIRGVLQHSIALVRGA
ncbi:TIM barrel protein [Lichenihabitans sp. Uapishka_5]|uniref:TIM barrel protein n=1 Tax=Lichenihabitans sp. Uapishka_5 TaxID=3037302 RepID=UPI0029E80190|nr:TIM barrel protein [Lichenihabitans sp. Uapishka_5]MDX7952338.1 TIM barrel protein [Lichenihabitans sp. Uapishka_5]